MKNPWNRVKLICLLAGLLTGAWVGAAHAEDLAKAPRNPVGNVVTMGPAR
jgi:hypothetical protein